MHTNPHHNVHQTVAKFVAAAFVISWVIGIVVLIILQPLDEYFGFEQNRISLWIGRFGPSLAGFFMMYLVGRWKGVWSLLKQALIWKVSPIYYLIALFLPFTIKLIVLWSGGESFNWTVPDFSMVGALLLVLGTFLFFGGGFGEEFGWRGFMLPELNRKYTPVITSLIIAVVWVAWHLPAFFFGDKSEESPLGLFSVFVFGASVFLTWLYYKTDRSILFVALFHASYNAVEGWVKIILLQETSDFGMSIGTQNWLEAIAMVTISLFLILFTKGRLGYKAD